MLAVAGDHERIRIERDAAEAAAGASTGSARRADGDVDRRGRARLVEQPVGISVAVVAEGAQARGCIVEVGLRERHVPAVVADVGPRPTTGALAGCDPARDAPQRRVSGLVVDPILVGIPVEGVHPRPARRIGRDEVGGVADEHHMSTVRRHAGWLSKLVGEDALTVEGDLGRASDRRLADPHPIEPERDVSTICGHFRGSPDTEQDRRDAGGHDVAGRGLHHLRLRDDQRHRGRDQCDDDRSCSCSLAHRTPPHRTLSASLADRSARVYGPRRPSTQDFPAAFDPVW